MAPRVQKNRHNILFAILAFMCLHNQAHSIIIDRGNTTLDTITGIEWLDVSLTVNASYNDILARTQAGGDLAGWRYASGDQVVEFIGHIHGEPLNPTFFAWQHSGYDGLTDKVASYVGYTMYNPVGIQSVIALMSDTYIDHTGAPSQYISRLTDYYDQPGVDVISPWGGTTKAWAKGSYFGSWLIRCTDPELCAPAPTSNVPEPPVGLLILTGLVVGRLMRHPRN